MKTCKNCGSYAINLDKHGRDGTRPDLCDVCFWREKAGELEKVINECYFLLDEWKCVNYLPPQIR